uniref:Uncharacterized protein n=1 Tax=Arundo donax TaxID=35708 RepID=A0A0A9BGZ1_ARUDO
MRLCFDIVVVASLPLSQQRREISKLHCTQKW